MTPRSDATSNPTCDGIQSRSRQQGSLPLSSPICSTVRQEHCSQGELIQESCAPTAAAVYRAPVYKKYGALPAHVTRDRPQQRKHPSKNGVSFLCTACCCCFSYQFIPSVLRASTRKLVVQLTAVLPYDGAVCRVSRGPVVVAQDSGSPQQQQGAAAVLGLESVRTVVCCGPSVQCYATSGIVVLWYNNCNWLAT